MVAYFILQIKGKCVSSKICLSVVHVGQIAPQLEAPKVVWIRLLEDAVSSVITRATLALNQVEMSHLATLTLLLKLF